MLGLLSLAFSALQVKRVLRFHKHALRKSDLRRIQSTLQEAKQLSMFHHIAFGYYKYRIFKLSVKAVPELNDFYMKIRSGSKTIYIISFIKTTVLKN